MGQPLPTASLPEMGSMTFIAAGSTPAQRAMNPNQPAPTPAFTAPAQGR